jgi:hypothetical protein
LPSYSSSASMSLARRRPLFAVGAISTGLRSSLARITSRSSYTLYSSKRPSGSLARPALSRQRRHTCHDGLARRVQRYTAPPWPRSRKLVARTRACSAKRTSHTSHGSSCGSLQASPPPLATTTSPARPTSPHIPSKSSSSPGLRSRSRALRPAYAGIRGLRAGSTRIT